MKIFRSAFTCSLTGLLLVFAMNTFGQATQDTTKLWKKGGSFTVTFSQTSLTNWSAGGENALASNALANFYANYRKNKSAWDNTLQMAYGLIKQDGSDLQKNEDKIDFSSKYGYQASTNWYYSALLDFKSQFTTTYKYVNDSVKNKISNFLAPAYLLYGIGMDYKPNTIFSLYLSPVTGKTTIVTDQELADAGSFGVEPAEIDANGIKIKDGQNIKTELGAYLKLAFIKKIMTNTDLQSKLELFSSYTNNPENIDVNWEVLITMKVNKFITANVSTQLIYDDDINIKDKEGDIGTRTQFKEVFGVGISFRF